MLTHPWNQVKDLLDLNIQEGILKMSASETAACSLQQIGCRARYYLWEKEEKVPHEKLFTGFYCQYCST